MIIDSLSLSAKASEKLDLLIPALEKDLGAFKDIYAPYLPNHMYDRHYDAQTVENFLQGIYAVPAEKMEGIAPSTLGDLWAFAVQANLTELVRTTTLAAQNLSLDLVATDLSRADLSKDMRLTLLAIAPDLYKKIPDNKALRTQEIEKDKFVLTSSSAPLFERLPNAAQAPDGDYFEPLAYAALPQAMRFSSELSFAERSIIFASAVKKDFLAVAELLLSRAIQGYGFFNPKTLITLENGQQQNAMEYIKEHPSSRRNFRAMMDRVCQDPMHQEKRAANLEKLFALTDEDLPHHAHKEKILAFSIQALSFLGKLETLRFDADTAKNFSRLGQQTLHACTTNWSGREIAEAVRPWNAFLSLQNRAIFAPVIEKADSKDRFEDSCASDNLQAQILACEQRPLYFGKTQKGVRSVLDM